MKRLSVVFILFLSLLVASRLSLFYFFPIHLPPGQSVNFQAVLLEDPKIIGNNQEFILHYGNFWQSTPVTIQAKADQSYMYGQTLIVTGTTRYKLLKNKQTILVIQNPQIEANTSGFLPLFGALRQKIINFCENNFSQPYSGLLVGVIFGFKSVLTNQVTTSFRITGISHLLVVDGLKITLVAGFVIDFLAFFLRRKSALLFSILFIGAYVALSGFEISAVRAEIMAMTAFGAQLFGRQYTGIYTLCLVGSLLLLWDPLLLESVAFQLSLLATAGIILLKPLISVKGIISDEIAITLAAQIATLPILLGTFGSYSLISLPVHILVMWTIPFIIIIGGLGISIGLIIEPIGKLLVQCIVPLLWYLQQIAAYFSAHAFQVQIQSLPLFFMLGYYLLLSGIVLILKKKR